jgi:hypothetical protein
MSVAGKYCPRKAFEVRALCLSADLARTVGPELVDHDAVIVEHCLDQSDRAADELFGGRQLGNPVEHRSRQLERLSDIGLRRFEFDDCITLVAMHGDIEVPAVCKSLTEQQCGPPAILGA